MCSFCLTVAKENWMFVRNHRGLARCLATVVVVASCLATPANLQSQDSRQDKASHLRELMCNDRDFARYPNLKQFLLKIVSNSGQALSAPDPGLTQLLRDSRLMGSEQFPYLRLSHEDMRQFLIACSRDRITMLRAIGLIARGAIFFWLWTATIWQMNSMYCISPRGYHCPLKTRCYTFMFRIKASTSRFNAI
jgi:hypothetical protein